MKQNKHVDSNLSATNDGAEICKCYHFRNSDATGECWGTRERDICLCKGDVSKCDYYPEKRSSKPSKTERSAKKEMSILDVSNVELGFFYKFAEAICNFEDDNVISFSKDFDADVELPQLFKKIYKAWAESDGSHEFFDFCEDYLLNEDRKFGNPVCPRCKRHIVLEDGFQRGSGEWAILCHKCGTYSEWYIPALLLPDETPVALKDGYEGVIIGNNFNTINEMKSFVYKTVPVLYAGNENREVYSREVKISEIVRIHTEE